MHRRQVLGSLVALPFVAGCGALPWIATNGPVIEAGVQEALDILNGAAKFIASFFTAHPDPAKQAAIDKALGEVRDAADGVAAILAAGVDVAQEKIVAALAAFAQAWDAFVALVKEIGLSVGLPKELGAHLYLDRAEGGRMLREPALRRAKLGPNGKLSVEARS